MNTHNLFLFSTLVYLISLAHFSSTADPPVFMWGNIQCEKHISALQVTDLLTFVNNLENCLDKETPVLVFAEPSLSPEDLQNGKNIFPTLSSLKGPTNYWPSVSKPLEAIDKLKGRNIIKTSLNKFLNEPTQIRPRDVFVINLNDAKADESRMYLLQRHDESINITKKMANVIKYVGIYTGQESSWITVDDVLSHRSKRDTAKAEPEPPTGNNTQYVVYSDKEVLISALDSPILNFNSTRLSLKDATISTENATAEDLIVNMVASDSVTIKWFFEIGGGYWTLKNITVFNTSGLAGEKEYYLRVKELYAPYRFSYHCANQTFVYPKNPQQYMVLDLFQLQVFFDGDQQNGSFGDAFDCTGFMTTPIWSGLFVTFILVLIMTCGLTMMMDIKTMDRFDDPKGKTITINASE